MSPSATVKAVGYDYLETAACIFEDLVPEFRGEAKKGRLPIVARFAVSQSVKPRTRSVMAPLTLHRLPLARASTASSVTTLSVRLQVVEA
jgi:hypothetical protein